MGLDNHVFVSYSHKDKKWLKRLETHLAPFVRKEAFKTWSDNQIRVGAQWREEIAQALVRANVAVLLVTPNFLASDFIAKHELLPLLQAVDQGGLTIVWIAISPSSYEETDIAQYQGVNDPSRPLDALSKSACDAELVRIAKVIKELCHTAQMDGFSEALVRIRKEMLAAGSGRELHLLLYRLEDLLGRNSAHPLRYEAQDLLNQLNTAVQRARSTHGMRREETRIRKDFLISEPDQE